MSNNQQCNEIRARLRAHLLGTLADSESQAVETHVQSCDDCRTALEAAHVYDAQGICKLCGSGTTSSPCRGSSRSTVDNASGAKAEAIMNLLLHGVFAGFLFRYGLALQARDSAWGLPATAVGFIIGMFVFRARPFYLPVLFVALGFGLHDLVSAFD